MPRSNVVFSPKFSTPRPARRLPHNLQSRIVDIAVGAVGIKRVAFWRIERRADDEALQQVRIRKLEAPEHGSIGAALRDQRRGAVAVESAAVPQHAVVQRPYQRAVIERAVGPREMQVKARATTSKF